VLAQELRQQRQDVLVVVDDQDVGHWIHPASYRARIQGGWRHCARKVSTSSHCVRPVVNGTSW
jgi:hypothetical protein